MDQSLISVIIAGAIVFTKDCNCDYIKTMDEKPWKIGKEIIFLKQPVRRNYEGLGQERDMNNIDSSNMLGLEALSDFPRFLDDLVSNMQTELDPEEESNEIEVLPQTDRYFVSYLNEMKNHKPSSNVRDFYNKVEPSHQKNTNRYDPNHYKMGLGKRR